MNETNTIIIEKELNAICAKKSFFGCFETAAGNPILGAKRLPQDIPLLEKERAFLTFLGVTEIAVSPRDEFNYYFFNVSSGGSYKGTDESSANDEYDAKDRDED